MTASVEIAERPDVFRVWLRAVRPFSFTASIVPILVGSALAVYDGRFDAVLFVAMLVASVAVHAGSNLANDYNDHVRGIDTAASLGPSGVIQRGWLGAAQVRNGMLVAFAIGTVIGLGIVAVTGWEIFVLALVCLALAYLYTGGPAPLGYIALGEVTVFVAMGLAMVGGSYYVLAGRLTWEAILASVPVGLIVAAILHANNIRDIDPDRRAGKVTLANAFGRRAASVEYDALVGLAYPALVLLVALDWRLWPALLPLATIPVALRLMHLYRTETDPRRLGLGVRQTAGLHLRFGFLLAAGILVAAAIR